MTNSSRFFEREASKLRPAGTTEGIVVPFQPRARLDDHQKLFKMAESLLTSLQRQLTMIAKSSAFAGNEDIERNAKVALALSAKIQVELEGEAAGGFPNRIV
jgi:hypothetical protein